MNCPKCGFTTESEKGFKMHMTSNHSGYSVDDLSAVGITPNRRDIARGMAGNNSASEVTSQAPDSEPTLFDMGSPAKKPRKARQAQQSESPEAQAAKERILRLRCSRMASLPYSLLANMLDEPSVKLTEQETEDLTQSYVTLAQSYGWEGASKLILWGDVLICHTAIVMSKERKQAIVKKIESFGLSATDIEQTENLEDGNNQ